MARGKRAPDLRPATETTGHVRRPALIDRPRAVDDTRVRRMLTVALLLLAFPGTASAAEMWVDPTAGSDRAAGTRAEPLRSLGEACRASPPAARSPRR